MVNDEYIKKFYNEICQNLGANYKRPTSTEKRHERCLYFDYNNKTYLLDSIEKTLTVINIDKLDKNLFVFNPEEHEYLYYGG